MTQKELAIKSVMDKLVAQELLEREAASLMGKSLRQTQRIKERYVRE